MIEVKHLTKCYGAHTAVDDLSFTVCDGRIYGFLGPNGAGKTTTMNIIAGSMASTSGTVMIDGIDMAKEPKAAKRTIGYLPENPPLYPDLTVKEYLTFVSELKKTNPKTRREEIAGIMDSLELSGAGGRLIRNLSKGYRQRTAFAQALVGNPRTLILDEPTSGLDPKQITEVRALIKQLGGKHTVLLSSHILSEVSEICDEVLILNRGRLAAAGTPESLRDSKSSSEELVVTAEGGETEMRRALTTLSLIPEENPECTLTDNGDGTCTLRVRGEDTPVLRREIGRTLGAEKLAILEMKTETASLEDIFLSLTSGDAENTDREGGQHGSDL